jgi:hypothetical protein
MSALMFCNLAAQRHSAILTLTGDINFSISLLLLLGLLRQSGQFNRLFCWSAALNSLLPSPFFYDSSCFSRHTHSLTHHCTPTEWRRPTRRPRRLRLPQPALRNLLPQPPSRPLSPPVLLLLLLLLSNPTRSRHRTGQQWRMLAGQATHRTTLRPSPPPTRLPPWPLVLRTLALVVTMQHTRRLSQVLTRGRLLPTPPPPPLPPLTSRRRFPPIPYRRRTRRLLLQEGLVLVLVLVLPNNRLRQIKEELASDQQRTPLRCCRRTTVVGAAGAQTRPFRFSMTIHCRR